jgi:5,5'-dehydrodivanillate O-demethylase
MQHFHMPNVNYRPPWAAPKGDNLPDTAPDPEAGAASDLVWRVPVDDYSVCSYLLDHLDAAALARKSLTKENEGKAPDFKGYASFNDAAEAVLRGETAVEDLRGMSNMTNVEDYVAQAGQGRIADRHDERLGRSDSLIVLLRNLWARDLRALAEGRERRQWRRAPVGAYERSQILAEGEEPDPKLINPTGASVQATFR